MYNYVPRLNAKNARIIAKYRANAVEKKRILCTKTECKECKDDY